MELLNIIDIIGISQGLILGTLILLNKPSKSRAFSYLGLYLILIGLTTSVTILEDKGLMEEYPSLYFLPLNFYFVFPALLYLYVREISGFPKEHMSWKKFWPGILEFVSWSVLLLLALTGKAPDLESIGLIIFEGVYYLLAMIFMVTYLVRIIRFIGKVKKAAENTFSDMTNRTLSWLRIACVLLLVTFLFPFVDELYPVSEESTYLAESIINSALVFWLAINGYKQTVVLSFQKGQVPQEVEEEKETTKIIPLEADKQRFQDLERLIDERELYKRQELTLAELAEEAGIHQKQLSFLINQFAGKNFFNFINEYRVKEAQQLLVDKDYEHLSFLGIAFEAGFNSKATFNASFKKVTGLTPRQYKVSLQSA